MQAQRPTLAAHALTLPVPSTSGNSLIIAGTGFGSVAGASITVTVTDDKSNTWTVVKNDPGGGNRGLSFVAYCIAPAAGTQVVTINASGGTMLLQADLMEWIRVTGVNGSASFSSAGSSSNSPLSVGSIAAGANSVLAGAFTNALFLADSRMKGMAPYGEMQRLCVSENNTGNWFQGWSGFSVSSASGTDSMACNWGGGPTIISAAVVSFSGSREPDIPWPYTPLNGTFPRADLRRKNGGLQWDLTSAEWW